jgi:hypothetical protein
MAALVLRHRSPERPLLTVVAAAVVRLFPVALLVLVVQVVAVMVLWVVAQARQVQPIQAAVVAVLIPLTLAALAAQVLSSSRGHGPPIQPLSLSLTRHRQRSSRRVTSMRRATALNVLAQVAGLLL